MSSTNILINSLMMDFLIQLVPIVIIALLAWLILSKIAKRFEKQNEERLAFEKENSVLLNKRLDELNERLVIIEKMLKEVD
ncbi:hypothetical protein HXV90_03130 [Lysinibacillus sp. JK80]|uniref:hypothetical protein n=1 Tax=Lysinibacillus sp. JK80 TaxID=2749809 RepID=UPI0022B96029|nr:hypothetical protein [Lysinibacillus sp. JK80]WBF54918.1 hypothetical protein HXV90_03130 [Lysinibacillus sp. JK80]